MNVSIWQLDTAATNASSGSTYAGFENGTGTTDGEEEAGTVIPPSKDQVCSREYLPARNSALLRFQLIVALWLDIEVVVACAGLRIVQSVTAHLCR